MSENAVPGFLPSRQGLHFANSYPPGPTVRIGFLDPRLIGVGDASAGLCGGMCFTVRDLLNSSPDQLLSIANFGEKTLEEVYKSLEKFGFYRSSRQPK